MIFDLTYRIETSSVQKATALRDGCAGWLAGQGVPVRSATQSISIPTWEVVGVDTTSKQPFKEKVEAETDTDAQAEVEGDPKAKGSKVVAEVRRAT